MFPMEHLLMVVDSQLVHLHSSRYNAKYRKSLLNEKEIQSMRWLCHTLSCLNIFTIHMNLLKVFHG